MLVKTSVTLAENDSQRGINRLKGSSCSTQEQYPRSYNLANTSKGKIKSKFYYKKEWSKSKSSASLSKVSHLRGLDLSQK